MASGQSGWYDPRLSWGRILTRHLPFLCPKALPQIVYSQGKMTYQPAESRVTYYSGHNTGNILFPDSLPTSDRIFAYAEEVQMRGQFWVYLNILSEQTCPQP